MLLNYALRIKMELDRIPLLFLLPVLVLVYALAYFLSGMYAVHPIQIPFDKFLTMDFLTYVLVGIGAQLIDGALGMAYGVSASSFLLSVGVTPAAASAAVHVSEVFTTGASGLSHLTFRNVNKRLFKAMVIPGVIGAVVGAYVLTSIDGDIVKPFVSIYLRIMGVVILRKATRKVIEKKKVKSVGVLALFGGFLDSIGGGGWGPVVTSTLLSKGRNPQYTIGTVNATEFFVAFSSAGVFTWFMGLQNVSVIAGLVIGGVLAAPVGALLVGKVKPKTLMIIVGSLIIFLSLRNLIKYLPF
ncbi:MAG: sulfite exporter TauE/SafE family protein [Bacteroidota bacterium]